MHTTPDQTRSPRATCGSRTHYLRLTVNYLKCRKIG